jgi:hypothetical protein
MKKTSTATPISVGIICSSRFSVYLSMRTRRDRGERPDRGPAALLV